MRRIHIYGAAIAAVFALQALAQSPASGPRLGEQAYRVGKGVLIASLEHPSTDPAGLAGEVHFAGCDAKWVVEAFAQDFELDGVNGARALESRLFAKLAKPTAPSTIFDSWPSAPDHVLNKNRKKILDACRTAPPAPRNWFIPLARASDLQALLVTGSGKRQGNAVEAWTKDVRFTRRRDTILGPEVAMIQFAGGYFMTRTSYDCANRTMTNFESIEYADNGSVVDIYQVPQEKRKPKAAVPGSIGEAQLEAICMVF